MWKYVGFVLLIIFCVPAVLAEQNGNDTSDGTGSHEIVTTVSSDPSQAASYESPTTVSSDASTTAIADASVTTSSDAPTTTSSDAPTTTSSDAPTTPSVPSTPEVSSTTVAPTVPPPSIGKYAVPEKDDKNKTCIRAEMALRVEIPDIPVSYNLPPNASIDGSDCNSTDNTQILKLTDQVEGHSLTFVFVQQDKKNYVQNITFDYVPSVIVNTSGHFFSASEDHSYLCNSEAKISISNTTLIFSSVRVQAFGAQSFGLAEECDADDKVGDVVPIAVGCALGALVVIVLIAYLVGRRRSRQRGYQSV